jgi:hypothetical protein
VPTGMSVARGQKGLKSYTMIPQEVSMSSLSTILGLSVAGTIKDQQASVANLKLAQQDIVQVLEILSYL